MKIKKCIIISISMFFLCFIVANTNVFATEVVKENEEVKIYSDVAIEKVSEEEYNLIIDLINQIDNKLDGIDNKIANVQKLDEYIAYPAIRLTIDTPYLGIAHLIDTKLIIRDGVSAVDLASGYGIREVINNKNIKIATLDVAGIVVVTKDVEINKNMTAYEAEECKKKLISYLYTVNKLEEYLDGKLYTIVSDYYSEEKKIAISNITNISKEVLKKYEKLQEKISYINTFSSLDEIKENEYIEIYSNIIEYRQAVKNIFNTEKQLTYLQTNLIAISAKLDDENEYLEELKEEISTNISLKEAINTVIDKMEKELLYVEQYISNSVIKNNDESLEKVIDDSTNNSADITEASNSNADNTLYSDAYNLKEVNIYDEIYSAISNSNYESMKRYLNKMKELKAMLEEKEVELSSEQLNENALEEECNIEASSNEEKNDYHYDDAQNSVYVQDITEDIENIQSIYLSFLSKEVGYILANIQVNAKKVKVLDGVNITSIEDINYYYITMPDILESLADEYVSNSIESNIHMCNGAKEILNNITVFLENSRELASE